jgi:hypothetical protein
MLQLNLLLSEYSVILTSNFQKSTFKCMLIFFGRAAQDRTEIKDFGDPYTSHCTTTLHTTLNGLISLIRLIG